MGERNGAPWVSGTQCTQGQPGRDPRQAAPVHPLPENVPQGAGGEQVAPGVLTPRGGPAVRSGQAQGSGQWSGPTALSRLQCEDSASHRAALGARRQKPARRPAQSVCSWTAGCGGGRMCATPCPAGWHCGRQGWAPIKGWGPRMSAACREARREAGDSRGSAWGEALGCRWGLGGASLTPELWAPPR